MTGRSVSLLQAQELRLFRLKAYLCGLWSLALVLSACAETPRAELDDGDDASIGIDAMLHNDASVVDAGVDKPWVLVGTGQDEFVPLNEGDTIDIHAGTQTGGRYGGYHLFGGLRFGSIAPSALTEITMTVTSTSGSLLSTVVRDPAILKPIPLEDGSFVMFGLRLRLADCCEVASKQTLIRAMITTSTAGHYAMQQLLQVSTCPAVGMLECQ